MVVIIVIDLICDLSFQMLNEFDIKMVLLKVYFGEEVYKDWVEFDFVIFY